MVWTPNTLGWFYGCKDLFKSNACVDLGDGVNKSNEIDLVKLHTCRFCNNNFLIKNYLDVHIRKVHTGEILYPCDQCGKQFINSSLLKIHYKTHTDNKCFSCDLCNKSFTAFGSLKRHKQLDRCSKKKITFENHSMLMNSFSSASKGIFFANFK